MRKFTAFEAKSAVLFTSVLGSTAYITAYHLLNKIPPSYFTSLRCLVAGLTLFIIARFNGIKVSSAISGLSILAGVVFGLALNFLYVSLRESGTTVTAFLCCADSFLIPLVNWILFRKTISFQNSLLLLMGIAGLAFLTLNDQLAIKFSDLLLILSALLFATFYALTGRISEKNNSLALTCVIQFVCFITLLVISLIFEQPALSIPLEVFVGILYFGIIMSALRFWLQVKAQQTISASELGILFLAEPTFAAVIGHFFNNEALRPVQWLGTAVILSSVIISVYSAGKSQQILEPSV